MAGRLDPARGVLAAGVVAAGAIVTGAVTARTARRMAAPRAARPTAVRSVDLESGRIRFAPTSEALLPGRYSFWFAGGRGHARVGAMLERDTLGVERELLGVDTGDLRLAPDGRFNGWMYLSPDAFGVPYRSERVQTTQGAVPAWVIPAGDGSRWAVLVHGRASVRQEALRAVPAFRAAGLTVLLPSYRGDGEAPVRSDGTRYAVADAEWVDVESAILHALDAGATEVVLVGWSSGASIVLATAERSRVKSVITGVVLDSPVLDGARALLARGDGVPAPVRHGALTLLSGRWGGILGAERLDLDPAGRVDPAALEVPVLILQSDDDGVAPPEVARAFAGARPDLVQLVPFSGARHTRLWNLDPDRWDRAVVAWLTGDEAALDALTAAGGATGRRDGRSRRAAGRRAPRAQPAP